MLVKVSPSLSQPTGSWLIFRSGMGPWLSSTCTTMVRSFGGGCFCFSLGGYGTRASKPFGVSGVMTMKMISSTSSTSIRGVTLMLAVGPPLPPIVIAITNSPSNYIGLAPSSRFHSTLGSRHRFDRLGCHVRRRRCFGPFLLSEQAQLVNASGTNIVHNVNHDAILGVRVGLDEDALVGLLGQLILYQSSELVGLDLIGAEKNAAILGDSDQHGIFFIRILHGDWVHGLGHIHTRAMLKHGSDNHEDDQQHQHDIYH